MPGKELWLSLRRWWKSRDELPPATLGELRMAEWDLEVLKRRVDAVKIARHLPK